MQKYRTVYALDFPGFGESDEPREAVGVPEYAAWTAELIRTLHIEGTDILCHSFGGRVAILLAAEHPELVGAHRVHRCSGRPSAARLKYYAKVYSYKFCKRMLKHPAVCRFLRGIGVDVQARVKGAGSSDYQQLSGVMRQVFVRVVNRISRRIFLRFRHLRYSSMARTIRIRRCAMARLWKRRSPDAGLVVLENAGHFSYLDQFPRYISIVKVFLEVGKA